MAIRKLVLVGVLFAVSTLAFAQASAESADKGAETLSRLERIDLGSVRLAVKDMVKTFGADYPQGVQYPGRIDAYEKDMAEISRRLANGDAAAVKRAEEILEFKARVLLANPLLDFGKLLLIKRKPVGDARRAKGDGKGLGKFVGLAQQSSWQIDNMPNIYGWENEIAVLSPLRPDGRMTTFYKPDEPMLVADLELRFDAGKLMFSMPGDNKCWQVFEMDVNGGAPVQLTPKDQPDVHNFNSFYIPNGRIGYISTAVFQGVPCNTSVSVAMLYSMNADGSGIRQLNFDQDHNYCPTITNDGRILYLRWEYTDIPHVWGRYLFTMNPDGTCQRAFYGSGSYWPNSIFFARPIPNHPTKVIGVVTGHHVGRVGELVVFDPAISRNGADGVVQRIPGRGKKVAPLIEDKLTRFSWPKYLHPYPLSDKYFIVSAKPRPDDLWGIYLVDVFDNMTLIKEVEDYALLDPNPFVPRKKPPVITDRVDLSRKDALVYLEDIYAGPGLKGVPRGEVKQLRLFTYHFAYQRLAGITHRVGADGPWEPKRVLGTVPVEADGSAFFRVPANTPISMQPLSADGKALQLMRSWTTAMPGEIVSCVGCHEKQNGAPPATQTIAARKAPTEIKPWYGPVRGFSFVREVQPVLDKYCVGCHNGDARPDGAVIPNFQGNRDEYMVLKGGNPQLTLVKSADVNELHRHYGGVFPPAYIELRRFVRVGGFESDIRLLAPKEFHTDTSELFWILKKGHHGVELDDESWDRLVVWVDLNAPCHATWRETAGAATTRRDHDRRIKLRTLYAGLNDDPELIGDPPGLVVPAKPRPVVRPAARKIDCAGFPMDIAKARLLQTGGAAGFQRKFNLGNGVSLEMVLVPAGEFVMGDNDGLRDEYPAARVKIAKPFWIGRFEVTNEQYRLFDPDHDSRYEHKGSWSFSENHLGWVLNHPKQPVVRISQDEAIAFCKWLSDRLGQSVTLPTEAQWEYACRAGTDSPLSYGDLDTDFSSYANMADATIKQYAYDTDGRHTADILLRDDRFNDRVLVTADVGGYKPNAWGLHDMHGNVWEWTQTAYKAYPYSEFDGRNNDPGGEKVVRGGSWHERPKLCRSSVRLSYPAWQEVYNVGFRVVMRVSDKNIALAKVSQN
ncbi:MAG: SUMF1/EgtB/PvdO family nonheme iron enzyme [Planctomycetes bacterium]|nr:SUMF1/EgtB/PvdO family nonheme iron enzyme [Planctomycetota bacterium]